MVKVEGFNGPSSQPSDVGGSQRRCGLCVCVTRGEVSEWTRTSFLFNCFQDNLAGLCVSQSNNSFSP